MKTFYDRIHMNVIMCLSMIAVLVSSSFGQQYYNYNTQLNANAFPFSVIAGKVVQELYLAGEINQPNRPPSGNITKVYFTCATATVTFTNLTIKMGLSNITTLPAGAFYTGQLDTVYFNPSVQLTSTAGTFMGIQLNTPFYYDTSMSLIIEINQCGASTPGMTIYNTLLSGNRRTYNQTAGGCNYTYQGQGTQLANLGIDIAAAPPPSPCAYLYSHQLSNATVLFQAVSAVSPYVGWVAGAAATVRKTTNGGTTWTDANPNPGVISGDIYNIFAVDANNSWLTTSPSATNIYRTTNGGTNWTQVFTQTGGFIDGIAFTSATTGFAYGDPVSARWSLWKTSNGGLNWDSTGMYLPQNGSEAGWNNAIKIIGTNIWFGTSGTRVYHSTNFGTSWTFGATGDANSYGIQFNDLNNGLVGGGVLNKTINGGTSYTTIPALGVGNLTGMAGANSINYWYTRGDSLYVTTNSGTNWAVAFGDTKGLWGVDVAHLNSGCGIGWAVGDSGKIIRINVDSLVGIRTNNNGVPNTFKLEQNYPNPFNPTTNIKFSVPAAGIVKMIIYDVLGKEVKTILNEFKQAGSYSVDFDASSLSSGVYFYRIEAGQFIDTKKMVLLK